MARRAPKQARDTRPAWRIDAGPRRTRALMKRTWTTPTSCGPWGDRRSLGGPLAKGGVLVAKRLDLLAQSLVFLPEGLRLGTQRGQLGPEAGDITAAAGGLRGAAAFDGFGHDGLADLAAHLLLAAAVEGHVPGDQPLRLPDLAEPTLLEELFHPLEVGSAIEDAQLLLALVQPLVEHLDGGLVALVEDDGLAVAAAEGLEHVVHVRHLARKNQLEPAGAVRSAHGVHDLQHAGRLAVRIRRTRHVPEHLLENELEEALALLGLAAGEGFQVHVGVNEVLSAVIDALELVVQLQHGLHGLLEHVNHAQARAGIATRDVGVARLDHFVEQRVVRLESLVEQVVVGAVADVDSADEIDRRPVIVGIADDAGLQRPPAGRVILESQELGLRRCFGVLRRLAALLHRHGRRRREPGESQDQHAGRPQARQPGPKSARIAMFSHVQASGTTTTARPAYAPGGNPIIYLTLSTRCPSAQVAVSRGFTRTLTASLTPPDRPVAGASEQVS